MAEVAKRDADDRRAASAARESDGWAIARAEAEAIELGDIGQLLWLDARCQRAGMHALHPWWAGAFRDFYASGKTVMVCRKGLRAGGSASACRALVRDTLFTRRELDPGTIGVVPIMSSSRDEATDRFFTIRRILRACGIAPVKGDDEEMTEVLPGGIGGEYKSAKSLAGGGVIQLEDSQGHKIEMRILPAVRRAAVGYTGVGGFLDESDLWPNDPEMHTNPAGVVIKDVLKRFTTQPTARLYIFSASYHARSAHSERIDLGDTSAQFVARLGEEAARTDEAARASLAAKIGSTDPRLFAPADPMSPDIPAWVTNPSASIERCYQLSDDQIGPMLALYGGRAAENAALQSIETLASVEFMRARKPEREAMADVALALAPSVDGSEWGILVAGVTDRGPNGRAIVLVDASGAMPSGIAAAKACELAAEWSAIFAAVATPHHDRVQQELDGYVRGAGRFAPALASVGIYDGSALRMGPLRTLYEWRRIIHVAGLDALERVAKGWTPDAGRSPRLEALAAAATHLQLGAWAQGGDLYVPVKAPRAGGAIMVGRHSGDAVGPRMVSR